MPLYGSCCQVKLWFTSGDAMPASLASPGPPGAKCCEMKPDCGRASGLGPPAHFLRYSSLDLRVTLSYTVILAISKVAAEGATWRLPLQSLAV